MRKVTFEEIGYEDAEETKFVLEPLYSQNNILEPNREFTCCLFGHELDGRSALLIASSLLSFVEEISDSKCEEEGDLS